MKIKTSKNNLLMGFLLSILIFITVAASVKYVIGPSSSTNNAIVLWDGTTGWKLKNSGITISNSNMNGLSEVNTLSINLTDGIYYLQKTTAPTAADIGGSVGVSTNYFIGNTGGSLIIYWSDSVSLYSKVLAP